MATEELPSPPATEDAADVTPSRFAGRTAIVTGAGSGIGRATALRLAREGARVVAADVAAQRLEQLAQESGDLDLVTVVADVTDLEGVEAIVAAAGGRVDALANVAGIMDSFLPVGEVDDATWDRVIALNVTAVVRLTRAVVPLMVAAGGGAIVNITSQAGLRGSAAGVAYTASKHAVIGITKNTAVFYRDAGIRTNAVAPGAVLTNIEAPMGSQRAGAIVGPIMAVTMPPPVGAGRIAASITWLLSDDAANVNGAVLASDGGWSAA